MEKKIVENLRQINKRLRIQYQERKSKGIFVTCGKIQAVAGEVRCFECKEKAKTKKMCCSKNFVWRRISLCDLWCRS